MLAKFDHSSFSRSGEMVGARQNKLINVSRDLTTPLSGWFATIKLAVAMLYLPNLNSLTLPTMKI